MAREQTKGRGRFERKFYSPKDAGVYFSIAITPKTREEIAFYTPICAIATADAVRSVCGKNALVKWVNDVYVDGKNARAYFAKPRLQRTEKSTRSLWVSASICMKKTAVSTKK